MAQVNDEPFQRATVMLLGIGKGQAGLFDGPTAFTLQTRNPNDQFDLARTHGQQLDLRIALRAHVLHTALAGSTLLLFIIGLAWS
jgi:hypothetical protein